jgi:hypothetical protein
MTRTFGARPPHHVTRWLWPCALIPRSGSSPIFDVRLYFRNKSMISTAIPPIATASDPVAVAIEHHLKPSSPDYSAKF